MKVRSLSVHRDVVPHNVVSAETQSHTTTGTITGHVGEPSLGMFQELSTYYRITLQLPAFEDLAGSEYIEKGMAPR